MYFVSLYTRIGFTCMDIIIWPLGIVNNDDVRIMEMFFFINLGCLNAVWKYLIIGFRPSV